MTFILLKFNKKWKLRVEDFRDSYEHLELFKGRIQIGFLQARRNLNHQYTLPTFDAGWTSYALIQQNGLD